MGPQYDYQGQVGDLHHFVDRDTGEDLAVDQEDADYLLAKNSGLAGPTMSAPEPLDVGQTMSEGPPATFGAPDPTAMSGGPQMTQEPPVMSEGPGADLWANHQVQGPVGPRAQRVRIGAPPEQSGPRMSAPGVIDMPDGTQMVYKPGSKGGMKRVQERVAGVDPEFMPGMIQDEMAQQERRADVRATLDATMTANANRDLERAEADSNNARIAREKSEAALKRVETERETKWNQFQSRQRAIDTMQTSPEKEDWGTVILSAIVAGAGAYAATVTGGQNFAQDILNESKRAKVAEKQAAITKAKDDNMATRDELQFISSTLEGRRLEAQAAVEAEQLAAINQLAADKAYDAVAPQIAELKASQEREHQLTMQQIYQMYQVEAVDKYQAGSPGGWTRSYANLENRAKVAKLTKDANDTGSSTVPVYFAGETLGNINKSEAEKLNEKGISAVEMVDILDKVIELQEKGKALSPRDKAELARLNVIGALTTAKSLGFRVGTEQDFKNISESLGSGNFDIILDTGAFQARNMRKQVVKQAADSYGFYGLPTDGIYGKLQNKGRRNAYENDEDE